MNGKLTPDRAYPPDVSVIVVSWNVRALLVQCVGAVLTLAADEAPSLEVIVVDNASSDGSAEAVAQLGVEVIALAENVGYGRANNLGFQEASGRYVLVLNPDTIPCPGSIRALVQFADRHPEAGIIAPRLLNHDGSVQRSAFRFPTLAMAALDLFPPPIWLPGRFRAWLSSSRLNGRYPDEPARSRPFPCDHPLGAAMLIRRAALQKYGGFDPAIFMYSEEIDLAMRFSRAGYTCWQVPASRVVHLGGQSTAQVPGQMLVELWRSRLYLYGKHRTRPEQAVLRGLLAFGMAWRILGARLKAIFGRGRPEDFRREWRILKMALGKADA